MFELNNIPSSPGVYIFKDRKDKILYIGKAKNLRNRLKSYFQSSELEPRKTKMVEQIKEFSFIITSNEYEALVLEANLIKQHKPPYNIVLRDDKNYPYLKITLTEKWPKIEVVRKPKKDGNLYFGPYVPAQAMWEALSFIRKNFPIRTCKYSLNKTIRPCIQYQMKRCPAPCADKISREDYMRGVEEVILFLKGKGTELIGRLQERMKELSNEMKFEEAAKIRDQIRRLERIFEQQRVISVNLDNIDFVGVYSEDSEISVNVLFVRNGLLVGSKNYMIKKVFYETWEELIRSVVQSLYSVESLIPPKTVVIENTPEDLSGIIEWLKNKRGEQLTIRQPKTDEEKAVLEMSLANAKEYLRANRKNVEFILDDLKKRLKLERVPLRIGAFDISTLFGSNSVGSFVYWENGEFKKEYYRHLKIREVNGIDDYSSMRELVERTVNRFDSPEGIPRPDIVLIDGGKGQLNVAMKVMEELKDINIFALAKNPDRLIMPEGDEISLEDKKASSLLLKRIRDEAHRFAITYHKKLRKKASFESVLEKIEGVGKKRRLALLKHFGSIKRIKAATAEEIASLPGFSIKLAEKILASLKDYF